MGWFIQLIRSAPTSTRWRSLILNDFLIDMSQLHCHGPVNIRRCRLPTLPAVGLKNNWPANGSAAGLRRAAAIAADHRGRHEVRTVARHEQAFHQRRQLAQRRAVDRRGIGGIRPRLAIQRPVSGEHRVGRTGLVAPDPADRPVAQHAVHQRVAAPVLALAVRQFVIVVGLEDVPQIVGRTRPFQIRIVVVEQRFQARRPGRPPCWKATCRRCS